MSTTWSWLKKRGWRRVVLELSPQDFALLQARADAMGEPPGDIACVAVGVLMSRLDNWQQARCRTFRSQAHAWFHRAAPLRSSNRDDVGIFPALARAYPWTLLLAIVLAAASGCGAASGFGESTADICREALAHRDARARVCGDMSVSDVSQCDSIVWIPRSEGQQEACFRALDMLDCKALRTMPDACVGLFPPWQ